MTSKTNLDLGATVAALFASAERGDWQQFRSMFSEHAVLRQNVGRSMPIDEALPGLRAFTDSGMTLQYQNVRQHVGTDHVTELHDAVFTKQNGTEVRLDICVVMQFDEDGMIVRADEYLDATSALPLFQD